jgi:hypothetical protein
MINLEDKGLKKIHNAALITDVVTGQSLSAAIAAHDSHQDLPSKHYVDLSMVKAFIAGLAGKYADLNTQYSFP